MGVKERQAEREKQAFHDQTVAGARAMANSPARPPNPVSGDVLQPPSVKAPPPPGGANLDTAAPPDAIMAETAAAGAATPQGRAAQLRNEITRRELAAEKAAQIDDLKEQIALREAQLFEGQILTDAIPTGVERVDKAGQSVTRGGTGMVPAFQQAIPTQSHLPPEHPDRISHSRGQLGVDMRRGIPFAGRAKMALELGTPGVQKQVMTDVIENLVKDIPPGMPYMRVDPHTNGVEFLRKITAQDVAEGWEKEGSEGKFRWTSAASAGITGNSLGAVFDLAEMGSITGAVAGAIATRNLTFFKNAAEATRGVMALTKTQRAIRGTQGVAGETGFALAGREVGNLLSLAVSVANGREVDPQEVMSMFKSDLAIEVAGAIAGRSVTRGIDALKSTASIAKATFQGKHIITDDAAAATQANAARRESATDTATLNEKLDGRREKITVTEAEGETIVEDGLVTTGPSGQMQRMADEADKLASQGEAAKLATRDRLLSTTTAHRTLALDLGSDTAEKFSANTANDVLSATERMPLRAVPDDPTRGYIAPSNIEWKVAPDGQKAENGLVFQIMPDNSLSVVGAHLPEGLQGVGLGSDMYRAYLALGVKEGRVPTSGPIVEAPADAVWQRMQDEGWDVVKHPGAKFKDEAWSVFDDAGDLVPNTPVWSLRTETPFSRDIISSIDRLTRTASGKMAKGAEFERFRTIAEADELAAVKNELAQNTLLKADMAEALLANYEKHVLYIGNDGKEHVSSKALAEWMDSSGRVLATVFSPSERLAIREGTDGAFLFRTMVEDMAENKAALTTAYGTVLNPASSRGFRDNGAMLQQLKGLESRERSRIMNIMRENAPEQHEAIRALLQNEVRDAAYKPVAGDTVSRTGQHRFGAYINKNAQFLEEAFGEEYVEHLKMYNRSIARQTIKQGVHGVKRVINPPMLMAARTVMGVMNKWQRRVTAARRFQMQKWYGRQLDIIAEPEKLAEFVSLQDLQLRLGPNHKAVIAGAVRLGLVDTEEEWHEFNQFAKTWINQVHDDYLSGFGDPANQTALANKDAEKRREAANERARVQQGQTARPQSFDLPQ